MSTDAPTRASRGRSRRAQRERSAFRRTFAIALAALVVVGGAGAAISLAQGPRASSVVADPVGLAEASGQRVVFSLNQPIEPVDPAQVTVEPAAPFTVDASGRTVGIQFTFPLDGDTEYTITIADVVGASGGPTSTLSHTVRTATPPIFLLQRRSEGDDAVFSTDLSGDRAYPVFTADRIEDVRAGRDGLVIETADEAGAATLVATDLDGSEPRPFELPGRGTLGSVQLADRGGLIGYTYTDLDLSADGGEEAALYIADRAAPDADPVRIATGEDVRVAQWMFIPDTSYVLMWSFDGQLRLVDTREPDADPVPLGTAQRIYGVEAGTGRALVARADGPMVLDLTDTSEEPLVAPQDAEALGQAGPIVPLVDGATLRVFTTLDAQGYPDTTRVLRIDTDGSASTVFTLPERGSAILQTCASPSGQYAAVSVAPDLVDNPYDGYTRALPQRIETHIVEVSTGAEVTVLQGSDISWCRAGASLSAP